MPKIHHYTPHDLALVLGCSERLVRYRLAAWAPERACGAWWRLDGPEAAQALAYCLAQPQRKREGRPERPREITVALALLKVLAEAHVGANAGAASP